MQAVAYFFVFALSCVCKVPKIHKQGKMPGNFIASFSSLKTVLRLLLKAEERISVRFFLIKADLFIDLSRRKEEMKKSGKAKREVALWRVPVEFVPNTNLTASLKQNSKEILPPCAAGSEMIDMLKEENLCSR